MNLLGISDLMLRAFLECLILVGIHAYLGLHVIRRQVIFVDLALAQVAALGTTVGFLFGMAPDSPAALLYSMLFTFLAAAIFAATRTRRERVPQEAIIGVVFAVAASLVILVVDRAPHGAEHIKEVMTGAILWVSWEAVGLAALVYSLVGIFHFLFRRQFTTISQDVDAARRAGLKVWWWDFLFYVSFGLVISISVRTAGVLLVFVFLVVPAIVATMITGRLFYQLLIGWGMGLLVTVLGLSASYYLDMPAGPSVVGFYGLVLALAGVFIYLLRSADRRRALAHLGLGSLVTLGLAGAVWLAGHLLAGTSLVHGHEQPPPPAVTGNVPGKKDSGAATAATTGTGTPGALPDEGQQLSEARRLIESDRPAAAGKLLALLRRSELPFIRAQALEELQKLAGRDFAIDPDLPASAPENSAGLEKLLDWVKSLRG